MSVRVTDADIARLIGQPKPVPADWRTKLKPKAKRGHSEAQLDVVGVDGDAFRIIVRQTLSNLLAFSVILAWRAPGSNVLFRLRRYNGRAHWHSNTIEADRFYSAHIHLATERYQAIGEREDFFAEPSNRFADLDGALACMAVDCALAAPGPSQLTLFDWEADDADR